nr:baseplate J/gp47 family protein [Aliamphritea spongicola]
MPFSRKTLPQLRQQIAVDIERYSGQAASSRGDIYYPLAQAVAGAVHGLHGHLQYTVEQLFDQSADDTNLLRRAAEMGIYRLPASHASGLLTLTGNNGVSIPAETLLQDDNQKIYRSTQTVSLTNGTANLPVEAAEAGSAGNLISGTTLQFITPVSGVDTQASVISLSGGADAETISRVRERLAERRKHPPMGAVLRTISPGPKVLMRTLPVLGVHRMHWAWEQLWFVLSPTI